MEPLDSKALNGLKLSLSGDHQFSNAGLAVSLCKSWFQRTGNWEKLFQKVRYTNPLSPFMYYVKSYVNLVSDFKLIDTVFFYGLNHVKF